MIISGGRGKGQMVLQLNTRSKDDCNTLDRLRGSSLRGAVGMGDGLAGDVMARVMVEWVETGFCVTRDDAARYLYPSFILRWSSKRHCRNEKHTTNQITWILEDAWA